MSLAQAAEMNEIWPDIYHESYVDQFHPRPTHKIQ